MLNITQFLSSTLVLILIILHGDLSAGAKGAPYNEEGVSTITCAYYSENDPDCKDGKCPRPCEGSPKPYCFATWKNGTDGQIEIEMQGCWSVEDDCMNDSQCVQSPSIQHLNFCCCSEPLCNIKVKNVYYPPTLSPPTTTVPLVGLAAVIVLVFWMWKRFKRQVYYRQQLPTVDPTRDLPPSPGPERPIKLIEVRARGRFGTVWKAQLHDKLVAVKKFPLQDRHSWTTEQDIYRLPHMNHENILKFIGTERRGDNLSLELWLITEFHQNGSLCEYLKGNTITLSELIKMAGSMARGLAFLHDEIPALGDKAAKPAVAHRDFKSKNVLINTDLSCCIADFGLALKFEPGKNPGETHGLVGTRRYMAPEVLEGAISFNRDAFLRIDMYACGMVLWELLARCTATDASVGEYQLPYEEEVGQHPTLEDMQELVVINKVRPAIKEHWLKHTECWDHDAEARLSADCVLERVNQVERNMLTSSLVSPSNTAINAQQLQPLIINTNQGLPPVTPLVQTI
ncbi:AVR2A-like protein [Mya arenaria]|uniref:Serine/threonine-protein kinase receptor n=1 Tax=Mya arenaria TaxID=6604 RepID=A0ABY7EAI0_MYAAR|nr:AVR2A-like protein [Mya arenaria]